MPSAVQRTYYKCSICGHEYGSFAEATSCEEKLPTEGKGAKVGDLVLITHGDGIGQKAMVTATGIFDKYWGHYAWERYWHTVFVTADLVEGSGSRMLTFDDYKLTY